MYSIGGGIVGALLAALPGFIDYLSIDEGEMKRIATTHLLLRAWFSRDLWVESVVALST